MPNEIKSTRDALESISAWAEANLRDYGDDWRLHNRLCDMLKAALALPRRNCDVGTLEEQLARFITFCKGQRLHSSGHAGSCNPKCPCRDGGDLNLCALAWGQMPYEVDSQRGGAQ